MRIIATLISICIFSSAAQADKLTIIHEDWAEAQQLAEKENKLIIIDYYATWCGPCKAFSANLKANEGLQNRLSKDFIMLKYDAEKDTNFHLTRKFHIRAYPTFVIVSPQVQYLDRLIGGALENEESVSRFEKFADNAKKLFVTKTYPTGYNMKLDNDYPAFYTKKMNRDWKYDKETIDAYWASTDNYSSEESFAVYSTFGATPEIDDYFLKHKTIFEAKYGKSTAEGIIENLFSKKMSAAFKQKDEAQLYDAIAFAKEHLDKDMVEEALPRIRIQFAVATENCTLLKDILEKQKENKSLTVETINSTCWTIYESPCTEQNLLSQAIDWMETVPPNNQDYNFMDTYAALLYKNKQYPLAKQHIELAIARAKKDDIDYKASTELLEKIESKLED